MIIIIFLVLIIGFILLFYGAKLVIISLEKIASRLGLSQVLIGLTVLSLGTSFPEIFVSIMGAIDKLNFIKEIDDIIIGNVIGAFLLQITFVLGFIGLNQKLFVSKWEVKKEGSMMIISLAIFYFFALDGNLTRIEGFIMIAVYLAYLLYIFRSDKKRLNMEAQIRKFIAERDGIKIYQNNYDHKKQDVNKTIMFLLIGFILLLSGAEITLISAIEIAIFFNIPSLLIGIFILGFGTTLPELVADLTALKRKSDGMAVGDLLGSNICDLLLASGCGAIISEFKVAPVLLKFDIPVLFIAILIPCLFLYRTNTLNIWECVLLLCYYVFYGILKLTIFQI